MDEGKIRGLAECLKRQQETGTSRKEGREMKDFLFLFKVLSFEQKSSRSKTGRELCLPFSGDPGWTWTHGQGDRNIQTSDHVVFLHSLFDTF